MAMAMAEDCYARRQRCRLQLGVVVALAVVLVLTPESLEVKCTYLLTVLNKALTSRWGGAGRVHSVGTSPSLALVPP
jgi:hypothetical protein